MCPELQNTNSHIGTHNCLSCLRYLSHICVSSSFIHHMHIICSTLTIHSSASNSQSDIHIIPKVHMQVSQVLPLLPPSLSVIFTVSIVHLHVPSLSSLILLGQSQYSYTWSLLSIQCLLPQCHLLRGCFLSGTDSKMKH